MFSGLVREIAVVKGLKDNILTLQAKYRPRIGDSIAVNGACLTAIEILPDGFSLELSSHTQKLVALENYKNRVHIEPALMLSDRLDGHIVQGHIDGVGVISSIGKYENQVEFVICAPLEILRFCIPKGSICIDGISLTIVEVNKEDFKLAIIPHTFEHTLFHTYKPYQRVNIETDIFVRSIQCLMQKAESSRVDWEHFDKQTLGY